MNTALSVFGRRLRYERSVRAVGQAAMAKFLGVSLATYSKWEQQDRTPSFDALERVARCLGLEVWELLKPWQ